MEQGIKEKLDSSTTHLTAIHTTIALQENTKQRLNNNRAPGQCYDGFINELVGCWERYRIGSSLCSPGKPINQYAEKGHP